MQVLYFNGVYMEALESAGLALTDIKLDELYSILSLDDRNVIQMETDIILSANCFRGYNFKSPLEDLMLSSELEYSDSERSILKAKANDGFLASVYVKEGWVLLYDATTPVSDLKYPTVRGIFNAMALIMPLNKVMQTEQYQHFIYQL